jgi:hypothetical protein
MYMDMWDMIADNKGIDMLHAFTSLKCPGNATCMQTNCLSLGLIEIPKLGYMPLWFDK